MTSLFAYSIRLPAILGHSGVNRPNCYQRIHSILPFEMIILDDIWTNWRLEDSGEWMSGIAWGAVGRDDGDGRSRSHDGSLWREWVVSCLRE